MVGQNKQKISITIKKENLDKVNNIVKNNPKETTSSVIDYSLDLSLSDIAEFMQVSAQTRMDMEQKILERKLKEIKDFQEDIKKIKEGGKS